MRLVICSECACVPLQEVSGKVAGNFVRLCPNSGVCMLMEFPADYKGFRLGGPVKELKKKINPVSSNLQH